MEPAVLPGFSYGANWSGFGAAPPCWQPSGGIPRVRTPPGALGSAPLGQMSADGGTPRSCTPTGGCRRSREISTRSVISSKLSESGRNKESENYPFFFPALPSVPPSSISGHSQNLLRQLLWDATSCHPSLPY